MKIVIVEDEIRIREGLIKLLNRISQEDEVVGEADNGQTGLELILEQKPDLIITDVQMPVMDGLQMLAELQKYGPLPKVMILSAYSEFSYAQQAIKLGVSEYLIKPIMINELTQSLRIVKQQIQQESRKKAKTPEWKSFSDVLSGIQAGWLTINDDLAEGLLQKFALSVEEDYVLILAYLGERYEEEQKKLVPALLSSLKSVMSEHSQTLEYAPLKSSLFLFPCRDQETIVEKRFQKTILPRLNRSDSVCFGWIKISGLAQLTEGISTLRDYMDWSITLGSEILIHYPKIKKIQTTPLAYPMEIENRMRTALCVMDSEKLRKVFQDFQNYFKKGLLYEPKKIKESYVRFLWSMMSMAKELDLSKYFVLDQQVLLEKIMNAVTNTELKEIMSAIFQLFPEQQKDENQLRLVIRRTQSLVHEFYARGITLDEIAEKLNVTPEYLGSQFHKEVGVTFSTYIKTYRIQKAKQLLIGTNLKLYEISEQIGYGDPKHFSKVFREITGQFPAEYRKINK